MALPQELLLSLENIKGYQQDAFLAAHTESSLCSIRLHPLKVATDLAVDAVVPWSKHGYYLNKRPIFTLDPNYHAGAYYVQEASSMFLEHIWAHLFSASSALKVLDLCAAPGGKSTLLASLMSDDSILISNDTIRTRATILEENATRWGYPNHWITCNDPGSFTKITSYFDLVVVDAPCSGSGLFRKDAKAIQEWSLNNVQLCSGRQQRILHDVLPSLKEGGYLIYSTCSYSKEENEDVLDAIFAMEDMVPVSLPLNEHWGVTETLSDKYSCPGYRFFPHLTQGEGFYIAVFQKKQADKPITLSRFKTQHNKDIALQTKHLIDLDGYTALAVNKELNTLLPIGMEQEAQLLSSYLHFRKLGIPLGIPSAKEWLPSHELALSTIMSHQAPSISVTKEQALRFLKKEEFSSEHVPKGWYVVRYQDLALGWIKSIGNRYNNYLPKHWRIRMELPDEAVN